MEKFVNLFISLRNLIRRKKKMSTGTGSVNNVHNFSWVSETRMAPTGKDDLTAMIDKMIKEHKVR